MARVISNSDTIYEMVLEAHCDASPGAVYAVLADLSTHLDWGGRRQRRSFRLTSLQGGGQMRVGTEFTSVGSIPMTRARWDDHSVVVQADPAAVMEFHTDSVAVWPPTGRKTEARWEHRYQIDPDGAGSRVTYRLRLASITNAPLRMTVPVMRTMTSRVMTPYLCQRGFANLLRAAERPATAPSEA